MVKRLSMALMIVMGVLALLTSCGGGGGTETSPYIYAEVGSFAGSNSSSASVCLTDSSNGKPIGDAVVTVNGVTLTYDASRQRYLGHLLVAPGDSVALSVTAAGKTYTASGKQFTAYPAISAPASGATWQANAANTVVVWSDGTPSQNVFYGLGVMEAGQGGQLIWPFNGYLQTVRPSVNAISIPENFLSVGNRLVVVGIAKDISIPDAASGSSLVISGFYYVPITIMDSSGGRWSEHTPNINSYLYDVIWAGTQFVGVGFAWITGSGGDTGTIYTSADGKSWSSPILADPATILKGVAWSGTRYVAVGYDVGNHSGYIVSSADGINWTPHASGVTSWLYRVVWSGTQFVAVGAKGTILTSPDGITWTVRTSNTSLDLRDVVWSGERFVAVGAYGAVLTSPDGVNWTPQASGVTTWLYGVAWSGTQFVAVGGNILTSPDGITWTAQTSVNLHGLGLYDVAWSGTNFAAVGVGSIYVSEDGVTWGEHDLGRGIDMKCLTWSGTQFLAGGCYNGTKVITSP